MFWKHWLCFENVRVSVEIKKDILRCTFFFPLKSIQQLRREHFNSSSLLHQDATSLGEQGHRWSFLAQFIRKCTKRSRCTQAGQRTHPHWEESPVPWLRSAAAAVILSHDALRVSGTQVRTLLRKSSETQPHTLRGTAAATLTTPRSFWIHFASLPPSYPELKYIFFLSSKAIEKSISLSGGGKLWEPGRLGQRDSGMCIVAVSLWGGKLSYLEASFFFPPLFSSKIFYLTSCKCL